MAYFYLFITPTERNCIYATGMARLLFIGLPRIVVDEHESHDDAVGVSDGHLAPWPSVVCAETLARVHRFSEV